MGRRFLSGQCNPLSTFGRFRGPLRRFCEAGFIHAPSKSGLSGRVWSDSTISPQIRELQVTGFRRAVALVVHVEGLVGRAADQALDENVGTSRGVKRARAVGVSVGVRPRGPSV